MINIHLLSSTVVQGICPLEMGPMSFGYRTHVDCGSYADRAAPEMKAQDSTAILELVRKEHQLLRMDGRNMSTCIQLLTID